MAPRWKPPSASLHSNAKRAKKDDCETNWLKAIADYVKETKTDVLDLAGRGLGTNEVLSVLKFLSNSQITELNLERNSLKDSMVALSPLLVKTKIKKLNVSECHLTSADLLHLAEVLKDSEITHLNISRNWAVALNVDATLKCVSFLKRSKVSTLISELFSSFPQIGAVSLFQEFLSTSMTRLDLRGCPFESSDFIFLFKNLSSSLVTDLNLQYTHIPPEAMQELSRRLVETKIEKLKIGWDALNDDQLNILVEGLGGSKVTDLDLSPNWLSNLSPLNRKLKETQIRKLSVRDSSCLRTEDLILFEPVDFLRSSSLTTLDLHNCGLKDEAGERLMETLRFSNVTNLDISQNHLQSLTVRKFAENVKDINLTDLDISENPLPPDALRFLGESLKESKLTSIDVSCIKMKKHYLSFLNLTKGSAINRIKMNSICFSGCVSPKKESDILGNLTCTELHLRDSRIEKNGLTHLLKFSAITYLNLSLNHLSDYDAATLAECLKDTQIRRLNLNSNSITCKGAKALALEFKNTGLLYLHLNNNQIEDDGMEFLAEYAKDTFISVLDVLYNPGKRILLLDKVLWENRISTEKLLELVPVFRQIVPQVNEDEFHFDRICDDLDVNLFLEKCMMIYKSVIDKPSAINILLEKSGLSFSRKQVYKLDEFPRQFGHFIACSIEADAVEHVKILEKAEAMGLTAIVEELLFNRGAYVLDKEQDILHPSAYKLLLKYKQPICSLAIEPHAVTKIIEYFTERADIESSQEVIKLLQCSTIL